MLRSHPYAVTTVLKFVNSIGKKALQGVIKLAHE
jgi:hypothetical protein